MTERQPGRDGNDDRKVPAAKPEEADSELIPDPNDPMPDEADLFNTGPGPRLFGEGSYSEGGSNEEGNFEERAASPHGGLGSFDDAGGFGGTELLGERGSDEAARRRRKVSDEEAGPDEPVKDS